MKTGRLDIIPKGKWFCSDNCQQQALKPKRMTVAERLKGTDGSKEYVRLLLWNGLNDMVRKDAVRENDGLRMIRMWKFDLLYFFRHNHPKYFILAHRLLTNINGGASARLRHHLTWSRTVNVLGGRGKNKAKDQHNEHLNREYKGKFMLPLV